MALDVRFLDDFTRSRAAQAADFLRHPRLFVDTQADYGADQHAQWVERTEADLVSCRKYGVAAYDMARLSGLVVAKMEGGDCVDIRNISISPEVRRRYFGMFAVRQLIHTVGTEFPNVRKIRVDTKPTNKEMIRFLESLGFRPTELRDLYGSGVPDLVLVRACEDTAGVPDDLLI